MDRFRHSRGFTLLELMVASAIGTIVAFGAFALIVGQVEGYNRQERVTNAQMLVRAAMTEVTRLVQPTGFGLPGEFTFGTQIANNVTSPGPYGTCIGTDVLEVRARNPQGSWWLAAGSGSTLLNLEVPVALPPEYPRAMNPATGDYLWPLGSRAFVFAGIGYYSLVRTSAIRNKGATSVALNAAASAALDLTGHNQVKRPSSQIYLVQVTRLRLVCTDPLHPLLVLEDDTDYNGDGMIDSPGDQIPIASDIEDLQVAYLIDADKDGLVSEADAVNDIYTFSDPNLPQLADKLLAIKGVRISLVARAASQQNSDNLPLIIEDHSPAQVADIYVRRLLRNIIIFDNRDTADPTSYLHLSNQLL